MGLTYNLHLTDVDAYLQLARESHRSLSASDNMYARDTRTALEEYEQLEPAPAVHEAIEGGCPAFWDTLRHFVGAEHTYWLYDDWCKWIRTPVCDILPDGSAGERLWLKLLGKGDEQYRMRIEGDEYLFEGGQFLYGAEINRLGVCLDSVESELLRSAPDDSWVCYSSRSHENIKDTVETHEFISQFIEHCTECGTDSILWLRYL